MKFVLLRLIQPNETFLSNSLVLFLSHSQYLIIIKILMNFIGFTKSLSKSIYLNRLEQLEKYGHHVRRVVPCTAPVCYICSQLCLPARPRLPAGDRAVCWVPRQLSENVLSLGYRR